VVSKVLRRLANKPRSNWQLRTHDWLTGAQALGIYTCVAPGVPTHTLIETMREHVVGNDWDDLVDYALSMRSSNVESLANLGTAFLVFLGSLS
jgi:hypothetical protein